MIKKVTRRISLGVIGVAAVLILIATAIFHGPPDVITIGNEVRAGVDYVVNGVDDHIDIQRALDNVAPNGEVVLLGITFHGGVLVVPEGITLRGQGYNSKYIAQADTNYNRLIMLNSWSRLEDIYIDGNGANQTWGGVAVSTVKEAIGILMSGIYVCNSFQDNIIIDDNSSHIIVTNYWSWNAGQGEGVTGSGVEIGASTGGNIVHNILIEGGHIWDCDQAGILTSVHADEGKNGATNISIINNTTENCGYAVSLGSGPDTPVIKTSHVIIQGHNSYGDTNGIGLDACSYILIEGNTFKDLGGIALYAPENSDHISFINNQVDGTIDWAVKIKSSDSIVSGNTISNVTGGIWNGGIGHAAYDVNVDRLVIEGNTITNTKYAMVLTNLRYSTVNDNITMNNERGITIRKYSFYNTIAGNNCSDDQAVPTQLRGIIEYDFSDYNHFSGNVCIGNTGHGVYSSSGEHSTFDVEEMSVELDLTGAGVDVDVFFSAAPCQLVAYSVLYSQATGGGAGVEIRVGKYGDSDYFDTSISEADKAVEYSKYFNTSNLTNAQIDGMVTVGTEGGKADTGKVILILYIAKLVE